MRLTIDPNDLALGVLALDAELDEHASETMLDQVESRIESGLLKLIVDCGRLEHISSAGLGALIRINHRLRRRGGAMRLAGVHGVTAEAFRMTNLDRVFELDRDVAVARGRLATSS